MSSVSILPTDCFSLVLSYIGQLPDDILHNSRPLRPAAWFALARRARQQWAEIARLAQVSGYLHQQVQNFARLHIEPWLVRLAKPVNAVDPRTKPSSCKSMPSGFTVDRQPAVLARLATASTWQEGVTWMVHLLKGRDQWCPPNRPQLYVSIPEER